MCFGDGMGIKLFDMILQSSLNLISRLEYNQEAIRLGRVLLGEVFPVWVPAGWLLTFELGAPGMGTPIFQPSAMTVLEVL